MLDSMYVLANDVACIIGNDPVTVPGAIAGIIALVVNLLKIGVPILLIIFGMLDLGKAVMAQKEDEIKKGQQTFVKRVIAAAVVFFVVFIVQMVVQLVGGDDPNIWGCVNGILGA